MINDLPTDVLVEILRFVTLDDLFEVAKGDLILL